MTDFSKTEEILRVADMAACFLTLRSLFERYSSINGVDYEERVRAILGAKFVETLKKPF